MQTRSLFIPSFSREPEAKRGHRDEKRASCAVKQITDMDIMT